ncbi:hypothetical protein DUI87_14914 [Hirundo rustica rustica]|uniref:Cytosolic carboxypeptidase N-terminal domain-containing protein n=1 Tax=Hirundo rustica rustica TaxID=333673 RepID=A0A3M0K649_HIRRU|nr:hypothetical protein DUI87_14914 [Hirundo rustica rustica]
MNRWEREKRRLKKRLIRQRIPSKNVYYYRCPDHRKNYVMSFAFCFDREDDTYQFAYCYPYTYTRLQHYLDNLQRRNMEYFCRELLGLSVCINRLPVVGKKSPARLPVSGVQSVQSVSAESLSSYLWYCCVQRDDQRSGKRLSKVLLELTPPANNKNCSEVETS